MTDFFDFIQVPAKDVTEMAFKKLLMYQQGRDITENWRVNSLFAAMSRYWLFVSQQLSPPSNDMNYSVLPPLFTLLWLSPCRHRNTSYLKILNRQNTIKCYDDYINYLYIIKRWYNKMLWQIYNTIWDVVKTGHFSHLWEFSLHH